MALGARLVELPEAAVGVGLQHALEAREMGLRVLALAVGREEVGHGGRIVPAPGPVVAKIDPDPPFLDPAGFALGGAAPRIEDADRRVVGVQPVRPHDLGADQLGQGPQRRDRLAAPVDQGGPGNVGPHPGEDLALAVQGQVIVELRDQDMGQQGGTRHSPPDRPGRRRLLDDPLAQPAGLLRPPGLDHLELGRDELEDLGQVLAEQTKRAAAVGAVVAGIEHDPLARRVVAKARFTPPARFGPRQCRLLPGVTGIGSFARSVVGGNRHLDVLERQLELLEFTADPLRTRPEPLPPQLGDLDPERLDQGLEGQRRRPGAGHLLTLGEDDRLQGGWVVGQDIGQRRHGTSLTKIRPW